MKVLDKLSIKCVSGGESSISLTDGRAVYSDGNGGYYMDYRAYYNLPPHVIAPCVMVPVSPVFDPKNGYSIDS